MYSNHYLDNHLSRRKYDDLDEQFLPMIKDTVKIKVACECVVVIFRIISNLKKSNLQNIAWNYVYCLPELYDEQRLTESLKYAFQALMILKIILG